MNFVRGLFSGSFAIPPAPLAETTFDLQAKKSVLTKIYQFKLQMAATPIGKRQLLGNAGCMLGQMTDF
jgi:hypothetical protein